MPLPKTYTAPNDLTDAEFAELDERLVDAPSSLFIGDAVMLDGYLCGVLVQPRLIEPQAWLARLFEIDDGTDDEFDREGEGDSPVGPQIDDGEWLGVVTPLVLRRHAALNRSIVEDGMFDPFILEIDEDEEPGPDSAPDAEADDALAELGPVSRALAPWVFGFQLACVHFGDLLESSDDAIMLALARLFRHLPPQDEHMVDLIATMDKESPIETVDEGIEELIACVVELSDLTSNERYHVETVRRETPKVGRNDPCHCGSGKKYKLCHGANG